MICMNFWLPLLSLRRQNSLPILVFVWCDTTDRKQRFSRIDFCSIYKSNSFSSLVALAAVIFLLLIFQWTNREIDFKKVHLAGVEQLDSYGEKKRHKSDILDQIVYIRFDLRQIQRNKSFTIESRQPSGLHLPLESKRKTEKKVKREKCGNLTSHRCFAVWDDAHRMLESVLKCE